MNKRCAMLRMRLDSRYTNAMSRHSGAAVGSMAATRRPAVAWPGRVQHCTSPRDPRFPAGMPRAEGGVALHHPRCCGADEGWPVQHSASAEVRETGGPPCEGLTQGALQ